LFRVLQEALHNAVKHSGMKHFKVDLRQTTDEIQLAVSDSGTGFDPEATMAKHGLGLISMRERISLIGGTITIKSKPHHGAVIQVRVPIQEATVTSPKRRFA
jgi:signal transduction histidine kinase